MSHGCWIRKVGSLTRQEVPPSWPRLHQRSKCYLSKNNATRQKITIETRETIEGTGYYLHLEHLSDYIEVAGLVIDGSLGFYDRLWTLARSWFYEFIGESDSDATCYLMDHESQTLYVSCSIYYRSYYSEPYRCLRRVTVLLRFSLTAITKGICSAYTQEEDDQRLVPLPSLPLSEEERKELLTFTTARCAEWQVYLDRTWISQSNALRWHLRQVQCQMPAVLLQIIREFVTPYECYNWKQWLEGLQSLQPTIQRHRFVSASDEAAMQFHQSSRNQYEFEKKQHKLRPKTYFYEFPPLDFQRLRYTRKHFLNGGQGWRFDHALPFDKNGQALFTEENVEQHGVKKLRNGKYSIWFTSDFKNDFF